MDVDEDEGGWSDWERDEVSESSDSDGWENVSSDGEDFQISDSEDEERAKSKVGEPKVKTKTKRQLDRMEKLEKLGKANKMDVDEEEEDDDAKSVVSAAATDASVATKKLSLLAQQKVSWRRFHLNYPILTADSYPCRFCSAQRSPFESRERTRRNHVIFLCQAQACRS